MTNDNSAPETSSVDNQEPVDIDAVTTTPEEERSDQDLAAGGSESSKSATSNQDTSPTASAISNGDNSPTTVENLAPESEPDNSSEAEADQDLPARGETLDLIQQSTTWSIVLGALMMVLGIAAISLPLITSLALTLWIGWLLVGNSVVKLIYAIQTRQQGSFWLKLLLAGLYLVAGVVLIVNPLEGVLTLTLLLGSFLITEGVVELLLAVQMRSRSNWLWLLLNALLTLALGVFIWAEWPLDAPWVIGLLVGISFIASGLSRMMLSIAVRSTVRQLAEVK